MDSKQQAEEIYNVCVNNPTGFGTAKERAIAKVDNHIKYWKEVKKEIKTIKTK
jgi:hypothetical protein